MNQIQTRLKKKEKNSYLSPFWPERAPTVSVIHPAMASLPGALSCKSCADRVWNQLGETSAARSSVSLLGFYRSLPAHCWSQTSMTITAPPQKKKRFQMSAKILEKVEESAHTYTARYSEACRTMGDKKSSVCCCSSSSRIQRLHSNTAFSWPVWAEGNVRSGVGKKKCRDAETMEDKLSRCVRGAGKMINGETMSHL